MENESNTSKLEEKMTPLGQFTEFRKKQQKTKNNPEKIKSGARRGLDKETKKGSKGRGI